MSKRRTRKLNKQQQKQREKLYLYGGIGLIVVVVIAAIVLTIFNRPPEVSAERLELDPVIGDPDAPITLVEYASYGCHACRVIHQMGGTQFIEDTINKPEFQGQVNYIYVNFPVINPTLDPISAEVAQCALDQGNDAFWKYHDAIYEISDSTYASYKKDDFIRLAGEAGLDEDKIEKCMNDKTHRRTVEYHKEEAQDAYVQGTPVFMINGRRINWQDLEDELRQELGL